jgi:PPP family 3-phenylpropionic acid transporter
VTVLHKFAALRRSHDVAIRLSAFYGAIFLIVGTYASFLPLWLSASGLSETQIALIFALPVLMRPVFTTAVSFFADRSGHHTRLLKLLAWGALLSLSLLPFGRGFPPIFAAFSFFALCWTTVLPLTDAVALSAARSGAADYGRVRLWGSASYITVILAGGLAVDMAGPPAALWLFIGSAMVLVLASQFLPDMEQVRRIPGAEPGGMRAIRLVDLTALIRLPAVWLFLATASAVQATHAVYYIFGTIHWTSIGIAPTVIGLLWCIGVVAEIVLFAYSRLLTERIGPVGLMLMGAAAALIRWTVTAFDPPLPVLFAAQLLHAITFGVTYLGAMQFMTRAFPANMAATAQGIYASFTAGIGMGSAYLAAGPLYRSFGSGAYLGMAALGLAGLVFGALLLRSWDGGSVVSAPERA